MNLGSSCRPTAANCMQRKAKFTRRRDWAAGRRSYYLAAVLQSFLLDVPLANYSFRIHLIGSNALLSVWLPAVQSALPLAG